MDVSKLKTFKNEYSIQDFELLAARGEHQEAYWAGSLMSMMGVEVDEKIMENTTLVVENHWPEIYEEREEKQKLEEKRLKKNV